MGHTDSRPGIDREWVTRTSKLSRLKLSEEEIAEILPQLGQILDHVDQLRSIPTEGVEPFIHPLLELLPESSAASFRPDVARAAEQDPAAILDCAPELTDRAFQVPQAVSQSRGHSK